MSDSVESEMQDLIEKWRRQADAMEECIDDPTDRQQFIIGFFRARSNELEARLNRTQ